MTELKKRDLNRMHRIVAVQEMYQEEKAKHECVTDRWIHRNVIYPAFFISLRTMQVYLATPATRYIKIIEEIINKETDALDSTTNPAATK